MFNIVLFPLIELFYRVSIKKSLFVTRLLNKNGNLHRNKKSTKTFLNEGNLKLWLLRCFNYKYVTATPTLSGQKFNINQVIF